MTDSTPISFDPVPAIARELGLPAAGVRAVVRLLEEGGTVPFIARYRKEATGSLDEVQIRNIEERRAYLIELDDRRKAILESIDSQGKLTPELKARILACDTKAALEDLYLPYKPKRRTRGIIAKERGLEPLAKRIAEQPTSGKPLEEAATYVSVEKEVPDVKAALAGARDIIAEWLAENADARARVRETFAERGMLVCEKAAGLPDAPTKFEQYYDYREPLKTIPSHRFLAIRRGERENVLRARVEVEPEPLVASLAGVMARKPASPFADELTQAVEDGYKRLLAPSVENDLRIELKLRSDRSAVDVFADNLRNLLMSAPLGEKGVLGLDPGLRTGCKFVAVDANGKFLAETVLHLSKGAGAEEAAKKQLLAYVQQYKPRAVAIGNGTGGREAERFVRAVLKDAALSDLTVVQVNEAGASVYSASDVAREEHPDLDITVRGALSIARRLQDPLAELVKIDPKAIGVGQYQHDVHQPLLAKKLDEVVESCVNGVGVELNTASAPLLSRVSGIGPSLAKKIIKFRDDHGRFKSRLELLEVPGLGPRAFEQSAGFLRVAGGAHPLDGSSVHPERYELVQRMASDLGLKVEELVGNAAAVAQVDVKKYIGDNVGEPTLRDILAELKKPGRDPRADFEPPKFRDDVEKLEDLVIGMQLEGVVTNVTAFGAFVDVGVHQDGLVHVSQLSDRFIKDPSEAVKVGDKIKVRVLEVDLARKRIALSARSEGARPQGGPRSEQAAQGGGQRPAPQRGHGQGGGARPPQRPEPEKFANNPFAKLLKR
ncbi:MAG: Transcription accessory protein [Myxococcaceae bacterium]|nr:Transcription accessory protein [Myxococcaceae bacterium]